MRHLPPCPPPANRALVDLSDFQGYVRPAWWGRCPLVDDIPLPTPDVPEGNNP